MKAKLRQWLAIIAFGALSVLVYPNQTFANSAKLRPVDAIRIAESMRLVAFAADSLGIAGQFPLTMLFVDDSTEFLIDHSQPSADFVSSYQEPYLHQIVYNRPRVFPVSLLATFPAINGRPSIVIGRPEDTTARRSTEWVVTVAHEYVHLLQLHSHDYFAKVMELDLHNGDQTGMWMLNYPFPYDSLTVLSAFDYYTRALVVALSAPEGEVGTACFALALLARDSLRSVLSTKDYRYFAFQVWQEGLARFFQYQFAEVASRSYQPAELFQRLPDVDPFANVSVDIFRGSVADLKPGALKELQREVFYAVGFAEGLLLDRHRPDWRKAYLSEPFDTRPYFAPAQK
jgi:hypothetical protein